MRKVIDYRVQQLGPEGGKVLAVCLSSRRNLCIHERVMEEVGPSRSDWAKYMHARTKQPIDGSLARLTKTMHGILTVIYDRATARR